MKPHRRYRLPPPIPGLASPPTIIELVSDQEKAGAPLPPLVEPVSADPSVAPPWPIMELISEQEKAGEPLPPLLPINQPGETNDC
jgi:hypothetical protein